MSTPINIVWFKRDLRFKDNVALYEAAKADGCVIPVYLFEPDIMGDEHYSERHWRFVWQSLLDMESQLKPYTGAMHVSFENAKDFFERLIAKYATRTIRVYSHQEVGLACTFERDKQLQHLFDSHKIKWLQLPYAGVIRGLTHRNNWIDNWTSQMQSPIPTINLLSVNWHIDQELVVRLPGELSSCLHQPDSSKQTGGENQAQRTLDSFLSSRHLEYHKYISSPMKSFHSCSRLSAYLAWGNLSVRQVYQAIKAIPDTLPRSLSAFVSRLHWHCHFIQKFESECEQEFRAVNRGYECFEYRTDTNAESDFKAWQTGQTGIPMVDACMRCVIETGYLNFRMRAMLVSFLCHYLRIDWRWGARHLAQQFLDFEPGIHYPQIQMQAGITGTNTLRIYNPVKQAKEKDPEGVFIRQWVPEIAHLANADLFAPWQMPPITQLVLQSPLPMQYQQPIIDPEAVIAVNRQQLWDWRNAPFVRQEAKRVLKRHSNPDSPAWRNQK